MRYTSALTVGTFTLGEIMLVNMLVVFWAAVAVYLLLSLIKTVVEMRRESKENNNA